MIALSVNKGVEVHPKEQGLSIKIIDRKTNEVLKAVKKFNKPIVINETFYRDLFFFVVKNNKIITFDLPPFETVVIEVHSTALGDQIAWIPIIDLFQKKHNCRVVVRCYFPDLFKRFYPNLEFRRQYFVGETIEQEDVVNATAVYIIGYAIAGKMDKGNRISPVDCRTTSLQHIACHQLGIELQEVVPKFRSNIIGRMIKDKYVCITTCGTARMKLWNNPNGFPDVIKFLNNLGYKVIDLGLHSDHLEGTISMNGKLEWNELMNILQHADLMVSTTNGLQWMAWAVGTNVISINGNCMPDMVFNTKHTQVINTDVCHGCFNDPKEVFNSNDVNYCPRKKNFECSTQISSEMVINEIMKIL